MPAPYTDITFTNAREGGITARKLNKLRDDLSTAISAGGGTPGTGDMTKAIYDTNNNGKVDTCDSLAWTSITGKPVIGDMTKAVYDVNGDGISDHAALADAAPWAGITGKPTTFPPDGTAMLKSVYDVNGNGVVDTADAIPWGSVSGKPATFPPDSTAMLKSVYDTNADNIVDHAALADAAPWAGITGKPATFPPDSTAMLKSVYDTNANGVVDTCDSLAWSKLSGVPATFPPDSTAMLKATYDVNGNGVVDTCDSLAWGKLTGVPATFPPDSTAMLKSVYDTNANNKVDASESADTAPWTGITGKPATFTPSPHGATHLDNGSDVIAVVTTVRTGLAPKLSGIAGTYLDGTGAYSSPSGSGDMTKSVYDTNGNGVVDTADAIPWASITGKPTGNLVDPGTWTNLSLGTGWTAPTQAQYRVEVNGAVSTVRFRGMIQAAYGALGTTAFTAPAGAQPSMTRSCVLGGAQNTGTASDVASYIVSVSSAGVATIYFLAASAFVWADPAQTQQVYLDGLFYSL